MDQCKRGCARSRTPMVRSSSRVCVAKIRVEYTTQNKGMYKRLCVEMIFSGDIKIDFIRQNFHRGFYTSLSQWKFPTLAKITNFRKPGLIKLILPSGKILVSVLSEKNYWFSWPRGLRPTRSLRQSQQKTIRIQTWVQTQRHNKLYKRKTIARWRQSKGPVVIAIPSYTTIFWKVPRLSFSSA